MLCVFFSLTIQLLRSENVCVAALVCSVESNAAVATGKFSLTTSPGVDNRHPNTTSLLQMLLISAFSLNWLSFSTVTPGCS